eukprot:385889-Pelagomonas_calceolata.AAC.1
MASRFSYAFNLPCLASSVAMMQKFEMRTDALKLIITLSSHCRPLFTNYICATAYASKLAWVCLGLQTPMNPAFYLPCTAYTVRTYDVWNPGVERHNARFRLHIARICIFLCMQLVLMHKPA